MEEKVNEAIEKMANDVFNTLRDNFDAEAQNEVLFAVKKMVQSEREESLRLQAEGISKLEAAYNSLK